MSDLLLFTEFNQEASDGSRLLKLNANAEADNSLFHSISQAYATLHCLEGSKKVGTLK